jgi:hypothetical protein
MTSKTQKSVGLKHGFRSGLEENEAQALGDRGIPFRFECFKIPYRIERDAKYTPDFLLLNQGIVLETKGRFTSADRQKHKMIKKQHPDLDIRFVFSNAKTRISKQSSTTYADWCEKNGFLWAHKTTPEEWLLEEPNEKSIQILRSLGVSI